MTNEQIIDVIACSLDGVVISMKDESNAYSKGVSRFAIQTYLNEVGLSDSDDNIDAVVDSIVDIMPSTSGEKFAFKRGQARLAINEYINTQK